MSATSTVLLRLREELAAELERLDQVAREASALAEGGDEGAPEPAVVYAVALLLHNFYTGVERMLLRVASTMDGGPPEGPTWHARLLDAMALEIEGVRPALLSVEARAALDRYLRFRHLVRNLYAFQLDWRELRSLAGALDEVTATLSRDVERFRELLRTLGRGPGSPSEE